MDRFALEDVREPFRADMRAALEAIGAQLAALADAGGPLPAAAAAGAAVAAGRQAVEAAEDGCHTITGSSALVGAVGLAAGAGTMRGVLAALDGALEDLAAAAMRVRRISAEAGAMLPSLERVLELELASDRAAADAAARRLSDGVAAGDDPPAAPDATTAPDSDPAAEEDGFSFFDEAAEAPAPAAPDPAQPRAIAPPAATAAADAIDPVLREAFASEAGELLDGLDHAALELERNVADAGALAELMRQYHTLKGAANTVGMTAIGRVAHRLEDVIEGLAAEPDGADGAGLAALLLRTQRGIRAWLARTAAPDEESVALELAAIDAWRARNPAEVPAEPVAAEAAPPPVASMPAAEPAAEEAHAPERRMLRVPAERLDALMDLAGELVQGRARLDARAANLGGLARELRASRERLGGAVDAFRERFEFVGLDGRRTAVGRPAAGDRDGGALPGRFGSLELDRYEDVHILSRSLGEIGNDIAVLHGRIGEAIASFGEDAERLGRSIASLQGEITRSRLIPLEQLFTRLRLTARDAAARADKAVRVAASGEDVAIDKAISDGLQVPLLHLVRNAVAHGIEAAEARTAAGKTAEGVITLSARQESGQIVIEVRDDGGGLDLAGLRRRGIAMGLIPAATPEDDEAVRELVFSPGLSTAGAAGAVSGRGYGCDVARREIQRLGGSVTVASAAGAGTVFTVVLPLTLAIARMLLVRHGGQAFAVPMAFVERILDPTVAGAVAGGGARRIAHAGTLIPLLELGEAMAVPALRPQAGAALLVRVGAQRWALRVDALEGQSDVVVGGLGELLAGHPLIAGVTVTGTGELVPIVDVAGVVAARGAVRPAARPQRRTATPAAVPAAARVLVVDDSVSVRTVLERQLRALGAEVLLAVDGSDALARLRQERVDLVFTDLEMPRMNGYELLRELRLSPAHRDLPIVVVTSRSGDKHRQLAESLGASAYLAKPFTADALAAAYARWRRAP